MQLASGQLQQITDLVQQGISADVIAVRMNVEIDVIVAHLEAAEVPKTHRELLEHSRDKITDLIEVAEGEYRDDPTDRRAGALTSFIQTQQGLIQDIDNLKNPSDVHEEVTRRVLQNLIRDMLKQVTTSIGQSLSNLERSLPPDQARTVRAELEGIARSLGTKSRDSYDTHTKILAEILGCNLNEHKIIPMLRAVDEETKQLPIKSQASSD